MILTNAQNKERFNLIRLCIVVSSAMFMTFETELQKEDFE